MVNLFSLGAQICLAQKRKDKKRLKYLRTLVDKADRCECGKPNTTCTCIMEKHGKATPAHPYMRVPQE